MVAIVSIPSLPRIFFTPYFPSRSFSSSRLSPASATRHFLGLVSGRLYRADWNTSLRLLLFYTACRQSSFLRRRLCFFVSLCRFLSSLKRARYIQVFFFFLLEEQGGLKGRKSISNKRINKRKETAREHSVGFVLCTYIFFWKPLALPSWNTLFRSRFIFPPRGTDHHKINKTSSSVRCQSSREHDCLSACLCVASSFRLHSISFF